MKTTKIMMGILIIATTFTLSCTKKSNQTAKTNTSSQTTPTTLNDVATAEAALLGTWIYDSTVFYSSGTVTSVVKGLPANSNDFQYTASSSTYSGGSTPNQKELDYARTGQPGNITYWLVENRLSSSNLLFLNGGTAAYFNGYIRQLDVHTLVTSQLYGTALQGQYFYLHK
jgi:FlaG/FlaF family flagellin (archaellin)